MIELLQTLHGKRETPTSCDKKPQGRRGKEKMIKAAATTLVFLIFKQAVKEADVPGRI
jgi:hypothetical protein